VRLHRRRAAAEEMLALNGWGGAAALGGDCITRSGDFGAPRKAEARSAGAEAGQTPGPGCAKEMASGHTKIVHLGDVPLVMRRVGYARCMQQGEGSKWFSALHTTAGE
jgi:hypothetical protein